MTILSLWTYIKHLIHGKYIVAECVPDTEAKKIHIISARKIKSDNGQVLNIESSDSPQPTSETLLDGIAADNSISRKAQNSNTFSQKKFGKCFLGFLSKKEVNQEFDASTAPNATPETNLDITSNISISHSAEKSTENTKKDSEDIIKERHANENSDRVYNRSEVFEALKRTVPGDIVVDVTNQLWEGLNSQCNAAEIKEISKVYTPPADMQEKWDKAHKEYVEKAAWVKQMLSM